VSLSQQVQRDVAQSKILNYLNPDWIVDISMLSGKKDSPQNGVIDFITIKHISGGISRIGFKSCDQGREKFQGTSLDYVWFDEEPPQDIYNECLMRVLDKKGDIFGAMTPLKGLTWVYSQIYLNPTNSKDIWCEFMQWEDNPYLDKAEIAKLESTLSKDELDSRKYGKFSSSAGLVYTEFDESVNVIEPFNIPRDWQDNISIDPGLNNPLACHFYAVDYDGNIYVVGEHFEAGRTVEYHAQKIKQLAKSLDWHVDNSGKLNALIDSAANQKTLASSKSVSELFYDNGINVNPKVNKDLFSGISKVKSYFKNAQGKSKLFIFKSCPNLIREIKSYFWGDNDVPIKKDDHCLDELRYYIMSRPENAKQKNQRSIITKDKDRLLRRIKNERTSL
jgi:phage terminase large subunit-like protein